MLEIIFLVTLGIELAILFYAHLRNYWVHDQRIKILSESEYLAGKYIPYDLLPSYEEMYGGHGFWRWDIKYYLPDQ